MNQAKQIRPVPDSYMVAIIIHIFIGWSYLDLSDFATWHLKHNAYLGLILALAFIVPFLWMIHDIASLCPGRPISAVFVIAFGKYLGKMINLIYIAMLFGFAIHTLYESQLMVGNYFLVGFDTRILVIIFAGLTLYVALQGIEAVGRLAAFMLVVPLIVIYIFQLLGLSNVNWVNVRPVFESGPQRWFRAGYDLLFLLIPVTASFPYLPFFQNPKSLLRTSLISLLVVCPLFLMTIIGVVGVFGPDTTTKITWPAVEFFHTIDLPFMLLEQAGLFFLITWYGFTFIILAQAHFILGHTINTAIPGIPPRWAIVAAAVICTTTAVLLPFNAIELKKLILTASPYFNCSYYAIIFLTWVFVRVRHILKKNVHNLKSVKD